MTEKKQFFFVSGKDEVRLGDVLVAHIGTDFGEMVLEGKENQHYDILIESVIEYFQSAAKKNFGAKLEGVEGKKQIVDHIILMDTNVPLFIFLKNGHLVLSKNMIEDILVDENLLNALIRVEGGSYMHNFAIHENSWTTLMAYKKLASQYAGEIATFSGLYPEDLRTLEKIYGLKWSKREFASIND